MVSGTFFNMGINKAKYTIQITEKSQGNCRNNCGATDFGEVVLWTKRETECMLKLRTVYPYGLNEKVDICEDGKSLTRFKKDDGTVGELFPSLPRLLSMGPKT